MASFGKLLNNYFWRTYDKKEIDYLEEAGEKLEGYEFKWHGDKFKSPKEFLAAYKESSVKVINRATYREFLEV